MAPLVEGFVVPQCFTATIHALKSGQWTLDFEAESGRRPRCVRYSFEALPHQDEVTTAKTNLRELFNTALACAAVPSGDDEPRFGRHADDVYSVLANERAPRTSYSDLMEVAECWNDARADDSLDADDRHRYVATKVHKGKDVSKRFVTEARKAGLLNDQPHYNLPVTATRLRATLTGSDAASFQDEDRSIDLLRGESHETTSWDVMRLLASWREREGSLLFECQVLEEGPSRALARAHSVLG